MEMVEGWPLPGDSRGLPHRPFDARQEVRE
jgi:hypothetical protein